MLLESFLGNRVLKFYANFFFLLNNMMKRVLMTPLANFPAQITTNA